MMPTRPFIEIKNLSVVYDAGQPNAFKALSDISLEIYKGEYVVFFGPSGCGKSTLLYTIAGLEYPTSGKVSIDGKNLGTLTPRQLEKFHLNEIGMVFQAFYLVQSLDILDNVALPQIFRREPMAEREKRALSLLERVELTDYAKRLPSNLSGGQQQRVSIARALVNDPPLLLADEPTGNLDSKSAVSVLELLYNLNKEEGRTIVLVSHDPRHIGFADRVFYMKDGFITKVVRNENRSNVLERLREEGFTAEEEEKAAQGAHFLVDYLTNPYDYDTLLRLEKAINERTQGHISRAAFREALGTPFAKGGVGLPNDKSEVLTERLEKLLTERALVREEASFEPKAAQAIDALDIQTQFILDKVLAGFHGSLDTPELMRLKHFIRLRVGYKIDNDKFIHFLRLSFERGGVGLGLRSARFVGQKVGLLLAQG